MAEDRISLWYLIGSLQVGGAERTLVDLANNLNHETFDVTIWTILDENPLASDLDENVTLRVIGASGKHDLTAAFGFVAAVRRTKPDILQSWVFFDNTLGRLASAASPGTTQISGVRAVPEDPSRLRATIDRLTMPLADHVVSNSEAGRELAIDRGASPDSVSVIENGRNLEVYASASAPDDLRDSLGISGDAALVGTVGRLIERKGHYDLLEAWPAVIEENPDARLLLVGDGTERDGLESRARELEIRESVTFMGTREDVATLLDAMDVFVFPSHFEGLPGALIEAMAAGLPIICTPVDGNEELIEDCESGVFVDPRSPGQIATEVTTLIDSSKYADRLGDSARDRAETRFSIEVMVENFLKLYDSFLST